MTCAVSLDVPLEAEDGTFLLAEDGTPLLAEGLGYIPSSTTLEGTSLAYDTAQVDDALDRLLHQFKEKPRIEALVCAFVSEVVVLDAAIWQLVAERHIAVAKGAQLDGLGQIVAEDREGRGDALYRAVIRAKLLALRSRGRPEDLIGVATFLAGDAGVVRYRELYPASVRIQAVDGDMLVSGVPFAASRLLKLAKPGAVQLTFVTSYVDSTETFTLATFAATVPELDDALGLGTVLDASIGGGLASALRS